MGNEHYRARRMREALVCYNRAAMVAAHSGGGGGGGGGGGEALSLAYANRQVLYVYYCTVEPHRVWSGKFLDVRPNQYR